MPQEVKAGRGQPGSASYSVDALPLSLAVGLLAFSRCFPLVEEGLYGRFNANPVPFGPTTQYEITLLKSLMEFGLISVPEQSWEDGLPYKGLQSNFASGSVCWSGNTAENMKLVADIEERALAGTWPSHWRAEVEENWLNLGLAEGRRFYDYCLDIRELHVQGDHAVTAMLKNILRDFSVGQCYRIIWEGAKIVSDLLVRKKISREQAGNYIVGTSQRWADAIRAEGYQVKPFKRHLDPPRSMMSYVLFDVFLKIGERGFTEPLQWPNWQGNEKNFAKIR